MKFFFDNNLSYKLSNGLKEFGENVIHLRDIFSEDTPDVEWLEHIGKEGLVLITRDKRIRYNPFELSALKEHKVGAFFIGGKTLSACQLIQIIVRNWPKIKESARKKKPPYAITIPPKGTKFTEISLT